MATDNEETEIPPKTKTASPENEAISSIDTIRAPKHTGKAKKQDAHPIPPEHGSDHAFTSAESISPDTPIKQLVKKPRVSRKVQLLPMPENTEQKQKRTKPKTSSRALTISQPTTANQPIIHLYTPLTQVCTYHQLYNISIRATKIWFGNLYGKEHPKALVFLAKDVEGTTIEVIGTGAPAEKWKSTLITGHTYNITNLMLGRTEKPYRAHRSDDQLFIQDNTVVSPCPDNNNIGGPTYYYHKLNRIPDLAGKRDVLFSTIGYVVDMTKPRSFVGQRGILCEIVEVYLIDQTVHQKPVMFTVWKDTLDKYRQHLGNGFEYEFILVINEGAAKWFNGKHVIESTGFTSLYIDPVDIPETKDLLKWVEQEFPYVTPNTQPVDDDTMNTRARLVTLDELVNLTRYPPPQNEPLYLDVIATVVYMFNGKDMIYEACPSCARKVDPIPTGQYTCIGCKKPQTLTITSYKVKITIEDDTNRANVTLFGNNAQLIMHEPVDVIANILKKSSNLALHQYTKKCLNITYKFGFKITSSNFKFIDRGGYTVNTATRIVRDYYPKPIPPDSQPLEEEQVSTDSEDTTDYLPSSDRAGPSSS